MSDDSHNNHHVNYLMIFAVLCVCSVLSYVFDKISFTPAVTLVLVMAVACTKAMCVLMYFMHLKFEGNWKYVLLAQQPFWQLVCPLRCSRTSEHPTTRPPLRRQRPGRRRLTITRRIIMRQQPSLRLLPSRRVERARHCHQIQQPDIDDVGLVFCLNIL